MTDPADSDDERTIRAEAILSVVGLVEAINRGDETARQAMLDALLEEPHRVIIDYLADMLGSRMLGHDLDEWRSIALEMTA
jgi:hypothetical protein